MTTTFETATAFELLGPLPTGTAVLEASAGTGKTFTIAALVARYIAEGVAEMDQLLVVSFSRESTRELRERVRERLVSARDGLAQGIGPADPLVQHLADTVPAELILRRRRLADALAAFDAATVTTTHGFCQQVLLALGTAGDYDVGDQLVEDIGDLAREVADDLYLRKWGVPGATAPDLKRAEFHELALAAARDPATDLLPPPQTPGLPGLRVRIATAVRAEVDRRKRRLGIVDYDDMLLRLARLLRDPELGPSACERLRERYRIVLVDEFQDTDPVQWEILRLAFHDTRTMVLIGDPKQSIYGFRGADVHSYLDAVQHAGSRHTLPTSYRSDERLLAGLDAVFRGAALGDPRIRVVPVQAEHPGRMVTVTVDGTVLPPVRVRVVPRGDLKASNQGLVLTAGAREFVARDVAAEIVGMLSAGGTRLQPRDGAEDRALLPGDVAVLVRTNEQARLISEQLTAARVPVVLTGRRSVFATVAAQEWQLLLEALEQPHRGTRVNRFALGCFAGVTAEQLSVARESLTAELGLELRSWAKVLDHRGVAALFETVSLDRALQPRLLRQEGGERLLTDLRHIAQALHEAGLRDRLGLTALLAWLRSRRAEAARDSGLERSRRLESDAAAVQVITVHTSKGLEFPVTMVPFGWDLWIRENPNTAVFHAGGRRLRDVGGRGGPDWQQHATAHVAEETDDELRLTYVALTRAQSHLVTWWAPATTTSRAPLHRLLMHQDPAGIPPLQVPVPGDADALAVLRRRVAASAGTFGVELVTERPAVRWSAPVPPVAELAAATLTRALDLDWRRTSYSALTATAHEQAQDRPPVGSEPEIAQRDDETDLDDVAGPGSIDGSADPDAGLALVPSAWHALPGGPRFGTLVHAVLEVLDDPAEEDALRAAVATETLRAAPGLDAGLLGDALLSALATPLGPSADGLALRDIAAADRLPELTFELPLGGGDDPVPGAGVLHDLAPLWREHCPAGRLAGYADVLDGLDPAPLRGYLTGSIDAVLRVGSGAGKRYLVVDYKTNRLGGTERPLTAWNYRPEAMEHAMIEAHYPLQALLYDVALHRYLRWRLPGYDPEQHLGGALYLFLRGMTGPAPRCADGSVPGVFDWRPPAGLVLATSDLLAGTRPSGSVE